MSESEAVSVDEVTSEAGSDSENARVMVDPRGARFAATVTTVVLAITLVTIPATALGTEVLPVFLLTFQALVFGAAALFGVKAQVYGRIYKAFIAPHLGPPNEMEDEAPLRFAQQVGFAFTVIALVGLASGFPLLARVAVAMALAAAFLNAVFNICLGCEVYLLWKRMSSRERPVDQAPADGSAEAAAGAEDDAVESTRGSADDSADETADDVVDLSVEDSESVGR